jgi:Ran-binding protein 3
VTTNAKSTVETGEEDEETIFANKGKLYCFANKQWKERGVGTFKVNVKSDPDGKRTGRMIMRADGALRVMLNSAIFKGMHFGDQQGEAPAGRRIFLASKEDGKVANVLLQVSTPPLAFALLLFVLMFKMLTIATAEQ